MSHNEQETCKNQGCERPARMAIRTRRPQRDNVIVTVWTDDRAAAVPLTADKHCYQHGLELLQGLYRTLVNVDDDVPSIPPPAEGPVPRHPITVACPACHAPAMAPCTAPTNHSRKAVAWFHDERTRKAGETA